MNLQVAAHQVEGYRVNTPVYEGPLDLLLQLIERAELDITTLALAQVTDQYLAHMRKMQEADGSGQSAAEVSGFLVIAARQLLTYKRFKELAAALTARETAGLRTYLRVAQPAVKVEARLDINDLTL